MIRPDQVEAISKVSYEPPKTTALKFVNQVSNIESEIGIRKIVLDDPNSIQDLLRNSLPPEAGIMLKDLLPKTDNNTQESSLPPEAAALMQQMLMAQSAPPVKANPDAGAELIRKRPEYLEKAINQANSRNRFDLDTENCSVLDLFVGLSTKNNVINNLKTLSSTNYEDNLRESIFYYTDIGLTFYFDEDDILNEIEVGEKYKHQTTKGLKIHDSMNKALDLYGPPRMKSAKGAIWNTFSILMHDHSPEIRTIRLKKR